MKIVHSSRVCEMFRVEKFNSNSALLLFQLARKLTHNPMHIRWLNLIFRSFSTSTNYKVDTWVDTKLVYQQTIFSIISLLR
jgi:hypothetical protein